MKIHSSFPAFIFLATAYFLPFASDGFASVTIGDTPVTIIREGSSQLDRAEGVVFSPDGEYIATANSLVDKITFYRRVGEEGSAYDTIPSFVIEGAESKLNYPHDIAFSPDGRHLAVANRIGNSITIYEKDLEGESYKNVPVAEIKGKYSGIKNPDSVRYSPVDNVLAVANLGGNTLSFYRFDGNEYEDRPFQVIKGSRKVLSVPDSLDFSVDGELLAVTSHDSHAVIIYQRLPGSEGKYTASPVEQINGDDANLNFPHSVSFHPSKDYLIVTNSQGKRNVNIYKRVSDDFPRYDAKPIASLEIIEMYEESTIHLLEKLRMEGGCKGGSFSPDGKSFAVTQNLCADLLKLPYSVGALLVYPFEIDP